MPKLYVVRHAQVQIDPDVPPEQWHLSQEGVESTRLLAQNESWSDVAVIYHSPEPKGEETARVIAEHAALPMLVHPDLHELTMSTGFLTTDEFQARVANYLGGFSDPDFEDYDHARNRIVGCVRALTSAHPNQSIVMVSHGRILTVLFSQLLGRRLDKSAWQSIRLPDLSVVDLETWKVERGFLSGYIV